ncbi:shikimate dehydrogenase [Methanobrevibacter filiformis]|uniref:Shikimate dehydrogenase (NADP(+)) n=1 Tax=Methanobrevibacter filiformis TaxID=55758 RepID=A0A166C3U8_9EURY|nr:shikimate dehydrogenase [Methanobrevibacter filiformis]KZX14101.1 shikimate dehydrogenase [Methanobrevibacter filiformis]
MNIDRSTKVLGLIGNPVEHSPATFMHNAAFKDLGLNYAYFLFNVKEDNVKDVIPGAKALGIKGFNVTIPHKLAIMEKLDEIDPIAKLIGAVNTVDITDGIAKGYNTDAYGAVKGISEIIDLTDKKVIVGGAGGASRAISFQLAISGIENLAILNRNEIKSKLLGDEIENALKNEFINENTSFDINNNLTIKGTSIDSMEKELKNADVLINTTPVGMYPNINDKPIAISSWMHSDLVVNDIVYNPLETRLLKEAKIANAKIIPGTKMLVYQGAVSFEIWTGHVPSIDVMEKAVMEQLTKKQG